MTDQEINKKGERHLDEGRGDFGREQSVSSLIRDSRLIDRTSLFPTDAESPCRRDEERRRRNEGKSEKRVPLTWKTKQLGASQRGKIGLEGKN